jgi:hypothetical protein
MKNSNDPNVSITFDGLMLFHYDEPNSRCEILLRRVHKHHLEINVYQREGGTGKSLVKTIEDTELNQFDSLWLYIEENGTRQYKQTASTQKGSFYKQILSLDGKDFYIDQGTLKLDRKAFHQTIYLCDGDVCVNEDTADCSRVTDIDGTATSTAIPYPYSFAHLLYKMNLEKDETTGKLDKQKWFKMKKTYSEFIQDLDPFSNWVNANMNLIEGQDLVLKAENGDETSKEFILVDGYNEKDNFWIHIKNLESEKPKSLGECKGLGHLIDAIQLPKGIARYSVFSPETDWPVKAPGPPWEVDNKKFASSEATCCLCAKIGKYKLSD